MIYYLLDLLKDLKIPGVGIFQYVTVRAILAIIFALIFSVWFGKLFIKYMKKRGIYETQRDAKIDPFGIQKKGVPSMGGIIIFVSIMIPILLFGRMRNIYLILMIVTTLWLGLLGFADDYIKTFKNKKEGLLPRYKLAGQIVLGLIVGLTLWASPDATINESVVIEQNDGKNIVTHKSLPEKSTITTIPFVKNHNLDYSKVCGFMGKYKHAAGWVLFVIITTVISFRPSI